MSRRKTQIFKNGKWKNINAKKIQQGDKFRLFVDGHLVMGETGETEFYALCNAYQVADGDWKVNV